MEEKILIFDYADLDNIWQIPGGYDYKSDDCFSTELLGFFDNNTKALLSLVSESTASECGDASGWCGFYIADLEKEKMTLLEIKDFGPGGKAQKYPYLVFPDLNYLVYCPNGNQLAVQNLLTGRKRPLPIRKTDPVDPEAGWLVVELEKRGEYLYIKSDWDRTGYFDIYFDLGEFKEVGEGEAPIYLKNPDGFWNSAETQYVWENRGAIYIYDDRTKKTEVLLERNVDGFSSFFHLAGWGY